MKKAIISWDKGFDDYFIKLFDVTEEEVRESAKKKNLQKCYYISQPSDGKYVIAYMKSYPPDYEGTGNISQVSLQLLQTLAKECGISSENITNKK